MPFPFSIKPFEDFVQKKLDLRSDRQIENIRLVPFVHLASGASVSGPQSYEGCVISNKINPKETYQVGETFIGYDLTGKKIITKDEKDRIVTIIL